MWSEKRSRIKCCQRDIRRDMYVWRFVYLCSQCSFHHSHYALTNIYELKHFSVLSFGARFKTVILSFHAHFAWATCGFVHARHSPSRSTQFHWATAECGIGNGRKYYNDLSRWFKSEGRHHMGVRSHRSRELNCTLFIPHGIACINSLMFAFRGRFTD